MKKTISKIGFSFRYAFKNLIRFRLRSILLILSFIALLIPIIAGTWKVLDALYVKPRDFRISVLEKGIDEIRKEVMKTPHQEEVQPTSVPEISQPTIPAPKNTITKQPASTPPQKIEPATSILQNMEAFFDTWKNDSLTSLQRDDFEKKHIGKVFSWQAKVQSISEEKNGYFWVGIEPVDSKRILYHAIAIFDASYKETLLNIKGAL